jgi:hypothetical protein
MTEIDVHVNRDERRNENMRRIEMEIEGDFGTNSREWNEGLNKILTGRK